MCMRYASCSRQPEEEETKARSNLQQQESQGNQAASCKAYLQQPNQDTLGIHCIPLHHHNQSGLAGTAAIQLTQLIIHLALVYCQGNYES